MKRFETYAAVLVLGLTAGSTARAEDPVETVGDDLARPGGYAMAGCGLGAKVFERNSKGNQILAATTNGIFCNQTFGISSGTSHCTRQGVVKAEKEQQAFVEVNLRSLERDAAAGGGEYLAAFGTLLGCNKTAHATLFQVTQQRYETIFPASGKASPNRVLKQMKTEYRHNPQLVNSCELL